MPFQYIVNLIKREKASVAFLSGAMIQRVSGFVLVTYLTSIVSESLFSKYGLFLSLTVVLSSILGLCTQHSVSRLIFDYKSESNRQRVISWLFTSSFIIIVIFSILAIVLYYCTSGIWLKFEVGFEMFLIAIVTSLILVLKEFYINLVRAKGRYKLFFVSNLISALGLILLTLLFIEYAESSRSLFIGFLSAQGLSLVVLASFVRIRFFSKLFNMRMLKGSLKFSVPIMFHLIFSWCVLHIGRWIGVLFVGLEEMASYFLLMQCVSVVGMIGRAVFDARLPIIGGYVAEGKYLDAKATINGALTLGFVVVAACYIAIILANNVVGIFPNQYKMATELIIIAFCSSLVDLSYLRGTQLLITLKMTFSQANATLMAGVLSIALSYFLVQFLGKSGLLVALLISLLAQSIFSNYLANKAYKSFN